MCTLSYSVAHRQTRKSGNLVTFHPCRWTLSSFFSSYTPSLASFPGSPHARTKSGKERGEPGKIYHVRNVIGRENLITCGRANEHTHALLTIYSFSRESFMTDRTGLDSTIYVTLPGSTASYGERKQTRTFENHANLLAYLTS